MAIDQDLTARLRSALGRSGVIREVKMFGGICFLLNGNMIAGSSPRGLLVRVGKDQHAEALRRPGAGAMEMGGRVMEGYVRVDPAALDDTSLQDWVELARAFVQSLPPKAAGRKPARKAGGRK
jgi:TfoX/Sxy family transcriptional regulator of competence genes